MARKPRVYGDTGIYHIILRGNNQENLFYDDSDRLFFLKRLQKYIQQLEIDLYSYCLMGNHVHLLIGKGNYKMPLLVKKIACSYVYYFNHKYERTGHLFQGRYKSEPVEEVEYFKTVYRYILQNPEKAGICVFSKYKWSSFQLIETENSYLSNNLVLSVFGNKAKLYSFLDVRNNDWPMENIYQKQSSDDDLKIEFIKSLFDIKSPLELLKLDYRSMINRVNTLKKMGISISQISRLTGISKRIIRNA